MCPTQELFPISSVELNGKTLSSGQSIRNSSVKLMQPAKFQQCLCISIARFPVEDSGCRWLYRTLGMQNYPDHPAVCSSVKCTSLCWKCCLGFSSCLSSGIECFSHVYSLLSLGKACNRISALLIVLREKAHCCVVPWENCTLSSPAGCNQFPIHY